MLHVARGICDICGEAVALTRPEAPLHLHKGHACVQTNGQKYKKGGGGDAASILAARSQHPRR